MREHRAFGGRNLFVEALRVDDLALHASAVGLFSGMRILYPPQLKAPSEALALALGAERLAASAAPIPENDAILRTDTVHIQIGNHI